MSEKPKSFFQTFTGVVTAITSLIVAITGLYAATDGFNFGNKEAESIKTAQSEKELQRQIQILQNQKKLDDLRIAQEKQKLIAEQEIAELKAKNAQLNQTINGRQDVSSIHSYAPREPKTNGYDLTGKWTYTNIVGTYTFVIEQNGQQLIVQEYDGFGNNVGNGSGTIQGQDVLLSWVEPYFVVMTLDVEAELTLTSDGKTLTGSMYTEGSKVPMNLYRQ